jgi:anaerobic selenocysteine-containing dehydrogenase
VMSSSKRNLTRRRFLQSFALGVGAMLFADQALHSLADGLMKLGVPVPWYRRGQVRTTYNYCDICPWRCGIVVKSVNGRVYNTV